MELNKIFDMSIVLTMSQKLSNPVHVALIAGVASSSYFFFANLGSFNFGIVPAIKEVNLPVGKKVALWRWFYDRGKVYIFSLGCII
jgi:hypothetical protein